MPADERLLEAVRPFLAAPEALPRDAAERAPKVLPGLVMAVAVLDGERMDFVPHASMAALGGEEAVRARAIGNLRELPPPRIQTLHVTPGDPSSSIFVMATDDPFCASRICDLDHLVSQVTGPVRPPQGVLITAPTWRMLVLHILRGRGALAALERMAQGSVAEAAATPPLGRVSADVFFVAPDGRTQRVAYDTEAGITVNTRGLIGEVFFGPQGPLGDAG